MTMHVRLAGLVAGAVLAGTMSTGAVAVAATAPTAATSIHIVHHGHHRGDDGWRNGGGRDRGWDHRGDRDWDHRGDRGWWWGEDGHDGWWSPPWLLPWW